MKHAEFLIFVLLFPMMVLINDIGTCYIRRKIGLDKWTKEEYHTSSVIWTVLYLFVSIILFIYAN